MKKLNENLKRLMRDDERYEILEDNLEEEENVQVEKTRIEILEEEATSSKKIKFPHENFGSFPNTSEEIIEETNRIEKAKKKLEDVLNERDEEISSDIILQSKKDLIKSMTDNVDALSQDEINKISLISLPKIVEKKSVEEHVDEIKKNNQDYIKKKSSVKLKVTPPRRSLRILSEQKKPYDKQ